MCTGERQKRAHPFTLFRRRCWARCCRAWSRCLRGRRRAARPRPRRAPVSRAVQQTGAIRVSFSAQELQYVSSAFRTMEGSNESHRSRGFFPERDRSSKARRSSRPNSNTNGILQIVGGRSRATPQVRRGAPARGSQPASVETSVSSEWGVVNWSRALDLLRACHT